MFALAMVLAAGVAVAWRRGADVRLCFAGLLLAAAAAGPSLPSPVRPGVFVVVDDSASTRGAAFREPGAAEAFVLAAGGRVVGQLDEATVVAWFTDGRADRSGGWPATVVVLDAGLDTPSDAAVRLSAAGDVAVAEVTAARRLTVGGREVAPPGGVVSLPRGPVALTVDVDGRDRWPENDAATLPPPRRGRVLWASDTPAPAGVERGEVPTDAGSLLDARAVVVGREVSADQARALSAYTRSAGGGLVLAGNPRSLVEASPLSADPPGPARVWAVLLDASGSMARGDRLARAVVAAGAAAARLPAADPVAAGAFARDVRWFGEPRPAGEGLDVPADLAAGGPTNLRAALEGISVDVVLVLSDGEADVGDPATLAARLGGTAVFVAPLAPLPADAALARLAELTGGAVVEPGDDWRAVAEAAADAARADEARRVTLDWTLPLPGRATDVRPAFLREGAEPLTADAHAAVRQAGAGRVAATAFTPTADEAAALIELVAGQPADPRLQVRADADRVLVEHDPAEWHTVVVTFAGGPLPTTEVAPGRHAATLPRPREPGWARVDVDGVAVAEVAVASDHAAEFDAIGNDRARAAGFGAVTTLDAPTLPVARRRVLLAPWLLLAALLVGGWGLVVRK